MFDGLMGGIEKCLKIFVHGVREPVLNYQVVSVGMKRANLLCKQTHIFAWNRKFQLNYRLSEVCVEA